MNSLEKKMVITLEDLKSNHNVSGIKAEFEAEGTRMEEALRLKEIVTRAGLNMTIKIGGCEALKDMYDARTIGINTIVAPMIESAYAMQKYVQAINLAFPEDEKAEIKFLINIETNLGYENIESIINSKYFDNIAGIVLGRVDMTGSLNMTREDINSDKILEIAKVLSKKMQECNKDFVIGGGVSAHSLSFFKKMPYLSRFETRKVIFDSQALNTSNADNGILKAVGFELMWLKNKRDFYGMIHNEDAQRLIILENRYKKSIEEAGGLYA